MGLSPHRQRMLTAAALAVALSVLATVAMSGCGMIHVSPETAAASAEAYRVRQNARYERQAIPAGKRRCDHD